MGSDHASARSDQIRYPIHSDDLRDPSRQRETPGLDDPHDLGGVSRPMFAGKAGRHDKAPAQHLITENIGITGRLSLFL